jgi:hypothetical protein
MPKLTERELQERVEILEARVQARETVIEQQRAVIRKQEIQNDKHDEWYESIQRQLKKRYDQIHELTIDLKNANDKLQWYAQNQESHAKTVDLMVERNNLRTDLRILAETYNNLRDSHNDLKKERDQIVEASQQKLNENTRDCETMLRAQHLGAAKPYKVKLFINDKFYDKTHNKITTLVEQIGKTGCEIHLYIENSEKTQIIGPCSDEFILNEMDYSALAGFIADMDKSEKINTISISKAANGKIARLEEILQDMGLVREPGGWVHPKHVVNHKKRRLTPAEVDMLIQNCCSRIESIHILVEKVQDLYEHVNDPKPYEFIETHYKVL